MRKQSSARLNWQAVVAVMVAALISVSCGGGMAQSSHAASNTTAADLTLNTSKIDFGNVAVGGSKTNSLTLTNSSPSDGPSVTFSQVTATGSGFTASTAALPITLAPGQASTVTLTFAPKAAGSVNGSLSITVVGAPDPATVSLTGSGVGAAQLAVAPTTLSFGNVAVGSSQNKSATLTAGSSSVTVSSAAWNGQGYSVSGIQFPVTVAAGKSISFTVTFAPQAAGSIPGSISFVSNAANSPTTEVFSGTGTQTATSTGQHTVNLSWDASTSSVLGYNVYRSTQSGGPYTKLNASPESATVYSDNTVQSGTTYYYVATSVDGSSVESGYSNQVVAAVPNP